MFDIGFVEMLMIAIVGMVVIGPERLPGVARTVGRSVGQLRRFLKDLQRQLEREVDLDGIKKSVHGKDENDSSEPSDEVEPPMPSFAERDAGEDASGTSDSPAAAAAESATESSNTDKP